MPLKLKKPYPKNKLIKASVLSATNNGYTRYSYFEDNNFSKIFVGENYIATWSKVTKIFVPDHQPSG